MNNQNFIKIDDVWYETTETTEATGLISNGKCLEGQFMSNGAIAALPFHGEYLEKKDWKALGATPARPLQIPDGDYDLSEFTAEEWARLAPGCVVEWTGNPRTVLLSANDKGCCVVKSGPNGVMSWDRAGVRPADNYTAYIVGRCPIAKEPEPVTQVTSEVTYFAGSGIAGVPAEWAGKTVEIRLVGAK